MLPHLVSGGGGGAGAVVAVDYSVLQNTIYSSTTLY